MFLRAANLKRKEPPPRNKLRGVYQNEAFSQESILFSCVKKRTFF
jgi:hypothetical protein